MTRRFIPIIHPFPTNDFVVVASMLDFFGLPYSARSLNDYLHHHVFGSLTTEIADCLLQHGLQTTLINGNPDLFSSIAWKKLYLLDYPKLDPARLPTLNEVERIIKKGVQVSRKMPNRELIEHELVADRPVLAAYNPALLSSVKRFGCGFGLIVSQTEEVFRFFEPEFSEGVEEYEKGTLLRAILGVESADPSAKSLILVQEKDPAPTAPPGPPPEI